MGTKSNENKGLFIKATMFIKQIILLSEYYSVVVM